MGYVRTTALIGKNAADLRQVRFLVDSGSFYTILSPDLASDLGIVTTLTGPVVLADSRVVEIPQGLAYLRINAREGGIQVGVLDVPEPLLGVSALEALGFKINPVLGTLEETRAFGPAVL
jgi:predicted aspartyl protease